MRARWAPVILSLLIGSGLLAVAILSRTPIASNVFARQTRTTAGTTTVVLPAGPLALPTVVVADDQRASRAESTSFYSRALGRPMPYLIYLPPGYDAAPANRYPVLYMLHGMGGTYTEWYGYGIFTKADALIRSGELAPFIIVLPQGDYGYWVDHADGGPRWGTYVARDLVAEIDGRFRTRADPEHRAIGGLSMGAHGAMQLALTFPGVFGVVGAHSPTLHGHDDAPEYFGDEAYFEAHDPVHLVRAYADAARRLTLWLDVGDDDPWLPVVASFHDDLTRLGVPHVWRLYPGGHGGDYWTAELTDYLRFYGAALTGARDGLGSSVP